MDTNHRMDRMLCEQALELYREIETAINSGRSGYAKDRLTALRSFLKGQTQHSAFGTAHAYLPSASNNLPEWKSELAYSRLSIEDYLRALKREAE